MFQTLSWEKLSTFVSEVNPKAEELYGSTDFIYKKKFVHCGPDYFLLIDKFILGEKIKDIKAPKSAYFGEFDKKINSIDESVVFYMMSQINSLEEKKFYIREYSYFHENKNKYILQAETNTFKDQKKEGIFSAAKIETNHIKLLLRILGNEDIQVHLAKIKRKFKSEERVKQCLEDKTWNHEKRLIKLVCGGASMYTTLKEYSFISK